MIRTVDGGRWTGPCIANRMGGAAWIRFSLTVVEAERRESDTADACEATPGQRSTVNEIKQHSTERAPTTQSLVHRPPSTVNGPRVRPTMRQRSTVNSPRGVDLDSPATLMT